LPPKLDQHATPGQKLLGLYALLLFTGNAYSLTRLAEMFRCSKQTVKRMIEDIERSHGAEILRIDEGRERCYRIKAPSARPRVALTPEEIRQLVLCRDLVLHLLPKTMRASLDETIRKASVLLPDFSERCEAFDSRVTVAVKGGIDYSPFQGILSKILEAMRCREVMIVSYKAAGRPEPREHHVAPARLLSYRESLYVHGWKVNERGKVEALCPTTLAVHRMGEVTRTQRKFDLPEPEPPDPAVFGLISGEPFRVRVRFGQAVAQYVAERTWSTDQKLTRTGEGGAVLEFTARSEAEVASWVLGFGVHAELLAPEGLRARIAKEAADVASAHA